MLATTVGERAQLWLVLVAVIAGAAIGVAAGPETSTVRSRRADPVMRTLNLVDAVVGHAGFPSTAALVAELRDADPAADYVSLHTAYERVAPGAVGVYASPDSVWISRSIADGSAVEVRQVLMAGKLTDYGPARIEPSAVPDGDFDSPLVPTWTVQPSPVAKVTRQQGVAGGPTALRVVGTGRSGSVATLVYQTLPTTVPLPASSEVLVGLSARTRGLSRPLSVELELIYPRGAVAFFLATAFTAGTVVTGIPAGTSRGWVPVTIRAVAARQVRSVRLFVLDTGITPVRGTTWLSHVVARIG